MSSILNALPGAVAQGLIWGIMAIGLYITYKILNFSDLTVDGSFVTGACICAAMTVQGSPIWLAMLCAFLGGMVAGFVTGAFHSWLGIPPILAGILTQLMLWSVNLKILGAANVALPSRKYKVLLTQMKILPALFVSVVFVACMIGILYLFFGTELGSAMRATGNNEKMAQAQGINTKIMKILGLMLSNGIVALAGSLLAQYQGNADVNMGRGAIVIGLASIVIGQTLFSWLGRNFAIRLLTVALGGVVYYLVYQVIISLGFDTDLLKMLSALLVAIFLAVPYIKNTYFPAKNVAGKGGNTNA